MALDFKKLFQPTLLTAAAATIFTMPTDPATSVMKNGSVTMTNTDSSARTVTLYAVPAGGAASITNVFLSAVSIAAGASLTVNVPTLKAGDFLQGLASVTSVVNIQEIGGTLYSA